MESFFLIFTYVCFIFSFFTALSISEFSLYSLSLFFIEKHSNFFLIYFFVNAATKFESIPPLKRHATGKSDLILFEKSFFKTL